MQARESGRDDDYPFFVLLCSVLKKLVQRAGGAGYVKYTNENEKRRRVRQINIEGIQRKNKRGLCCRDSSVGGS